MDINHIGVVRLHELATTNADLDCGERFHLMLCDTCMQAFSAFFRKVEENEKESVTQPSSTRTCSAGMALPQSE